MKKDFYRTFVISFGVAAVKIGHDALVLEAIMIIKIEKFNLKLRTLGRKRKFCKNCAESELKNCAEIELLNLPEYIIWNLLIKKKYSFSKNQVQYPSLLFAFAHILVDIATCVILLRNM